MISPWPLPLDGTGLLCGDALPQLASDIPASPPPLKNPTWGAMSLAYLCLVIDIMSLIRLLVGVLVHNVGK